MTVSRGDEYRSCARELRVDGDLDAAADRYTRAAYEYLGSTSFDQSFWTATCGLNAFLMSATCDRIATNPFRARNRCQQAVLVASDVIDRELETPCDHDTARKGAWFEYIGDLRTVGSIEGPAEAYRSAQQFYQDHGHDTSEVHGRLDDYFSTVASATGAAPDRDGALSLAKRLEYKRSRLPRLLDRLIERDEWPADD